MSERETVCVDIQGFDPADDIFKTAFEQVDKDRNGFLDKKEFRQFMIQAKKEKVSKYMFNVIDKDRNGRVSLPEFLEFGRAMWAIISTGDSRAYMKMLFDACDTSDKGHLTKKEFLRFMKYAGSPVSFFQREKQFKKWDADGDGTVDFEEIMQKINFVLSK